MENFLSEYCSFTYFVTKGRPIPVLFLKTNHGKCPFLQQETCLVHQFKPYLCQAAPIISVVFENPAFMRELIGKCPGYGKGRMISVNEIQLSLHRETELELADKQAYQNGWFDRLLKILPQEVSNGRSSSKKPEFCRRSHLRNSQDDMAWQ
jgi:Fe-S-cluster containining protein